MNKILIILFLFFSITINAQNTFNKLESYLSPNGNSSEFFDNVIQYYNNYYGVVYLSDSLNIASTAIVKLNSNGDLIKKTVLKLQNKVIVTYENQALISTSDSNFIISSNLADSSWDGYLIKFNRNLDTLWTKVYDLPANMAGCTAGTNTINYFTAIKETPDKGFIIAGNYYKYCVNNSTNLRGFLLKVDSVGNIEWWKVYQDVKYLYEIELTPDGGFVFLNKLGPTKFTKTDSLGNIQWFIQANSYINWAEAGDISYIGNNQYVVALPYMYDSNNSAMNIYKIDANQQSILWDTTYFMFFDVQSLSLNQVMGLEIDTQGNLIIWATAHVNPAPYVGAKRGAVLKLNSQGDSLWARYYEAPNSTWDDDLQLNDLIIADDGGYMGVGYELNANFEVKAWIFKTDANGVLGWNNEIPIPNPINFEIYPNPTYDYITLKYNSESEGEIFYTITDGSGKMVLQKQLEVSEYTEQTEVLIDLRSLKPGVYYFNLINNGKSEGIRKLIVLK